MLLCLLILYRVKYIICTHSNFTMQSLNSILNNVVKKVFTSKGKILGELLIEWKKIVGSEIADICYPVKIQSYYDNSNLHHVLHIVVYSSYNNFELSFKKNILIERISTYFGFKAINCIQVKSILE